MITNGNGKTGVAIRANLVPSPLTEFEQIKEMAGMFVSSALFPDTKSIAQATVKILAGKELGMGPFESMRDLSIIQGKIAMAAAQIAARIKRTGVYDYEIVRFDDSSTVLRFSKSGKALKPDIEFNMAHAKALGLAGKDNYSKQSRTMLFWRAVTMGARMHCPDVFNGPVYTPDELLKSSVVEDLPDPVIAEPTLELEESPSIPEPLSNPWLHVVEGAPNVSNKIRGKCLAELAQGILEQSLKAAYEAKFSAFDRVNISAALAQPEKRTQALDELTQESSPQLTFEEDAIPEFGGAA